jgi:hypothetical protein
MLCFNFKTFPLFGAFGIVGAVPGTIVYEA